MQSGINVSSGRITGVLKHVTGYTGFSPDDPELQSGNYLALKFAAPEGATVKVGLVPSAGSGLVTLDSDMNGVFRVSNNNQKFKTIVTTADGKTASRLYDLSGLELQ